MPLRRALEGIGNSQYGLLIKRLADDLKADRHHFGENPHGTDIAGRPEMLKGAQNRAETAKTVSSRDPIRDVA